MGDVALDVEGMESKDFQGLYNGVSIHLIPNTNIFLLHEGKVLCFEPRHVGILHLQDAPIR